MALPTVARADAEPLLARGVRDYLCSLATWVNWKESVDTFKAGDPASPVRGIAVAWMSYTWALKRAIELGCNLFITHEPTYYDHRDRNEDVFRLPAAHAKREFVQRSGLVIFRCHDVWDLYPKQGVPDAWAATLGLSDPIGGSGAYRVFDVSGRTALDVARQVARATRPLDQPAVQLIGPGDARVHRLAIGCGADTPFFDFLRDFQVDLALCTDDGFTSWRDGAFFIDSGIPVILVAHPVSEEPGVKLLAAHLKQRYPQVPVHHIPQTCMYRLISL